MFLFINIFLVRLNLNRFLHGGVEALNEGVFKIRTFLDNPKSYFEKKSYPALTAGNDESSKNEKDNLKYITQNAKDSINTDDNLNQPNIEKDNSQNVNDIENDQEKLVSNQNAHEIENEHITIENEQKTIENENSKIDIDNNKEQAKNSNNIEMSKTIQDNQNQDNFENKINTANNINDHTPDEIKNDQSQEIKIDKNQEIKIDKNQEINNDQTSTSIKKGIIDNHDKEEIENKQPKEAKVVDQNQEIIRNNNDKQKTTNQDTEIIVNDQNPNKIEDNPVKNELQNNQGVSSKQLYQENTIDQAITKTKQDINQDQSKDEDYILRHFNYIDSIIYEIRSNNQVNPPVLIGKMRKAFISMKNTPAGKKGDYWEITGKEANFTIHFQKSVIKGIELVRTNRLCEIKSFQVLDTDSNFKILEKTELKYPVQQFVFPTLVSSDSIILRVLENLGEKDLICLRNYSIIAA